MPTDVLDRFEERLGDSAEALKHQQRLDRDVQFLLSHMNEWRKKYPNRWVAVYKNKLVAVEDTQDKLLKAIARGKLPLREVLIDFISEQQVAFVL